jgi:hypothetical protein
MKQKVSSVLLLVLLVTLAPTVSAQLKPIIWSESIKKTEKPVTEIFSISDHVILKSDRSLAINLTDRLPIAAIDIRQDKNDSPYVTKKDFLFTIRLSDNLAKIINIPFGETKFD